MASGPVSWAELSAAIAANPHRGRGLLVRAGTASATIAAIPSGEGGSCWLGSGWTEETTFAAADVLSFVLWVQDPMYRAAEVTSRRAQEQAVAADLLKSIDSLWRSHHGKTRGWVRKHLEEDLRVRAGGGEPPADFRTRLRTTRRVALFADFLLAVRGAHMAIWWPVGKAVTMIPMTGVAPTGVAQLNAETGRPLLRLTGTGSPLLTPVTEWSSLVTTASPGIVWTPPACAASMGTMTVAQIQERLEAVCGATTKRSGSRAALWTLLHWTLLQKELAGEGGALALGLLSDDSVGSAGSTKVT